MGTATRKPSAVIRPGIEVYEGHVQHVTGGQFRFGSDYTLRTFVPECVEIDGQEITVWVELREKPRADERIPLIIEIPGADRLRAVALSSQCYGWFVRQDKAGKVRSILRRLGVEEV